MLGQWDKAFCGCQPIAHRLRAAFPSRWVRFHSLPGSKRYPESEHEFAIVLDRHNRILGELDGAGRRVALLTTEYSASPQPDGLEARLRALVGDARPWRSIAMHETGEGFADPTYWHVYASVREWRPGLFDPVVRLVADDEVRNVMVVDSDCRWLLHPYDGGMDVIAESSAARDRLKLSYRDWLSALPSGL